jgi:hypothetical protein
VDLTGTTDQDIISIITTAGRTAEKWEAASKNFWLEGSLQLYDKKYPKLERSRNWTERPDRKIWFKMMEFWGERKKSKEDWMERKSKKDNPKTEGIVPFEIERCKAEGECLRCAWPARQNRELQG